ncbi:MAG: HEAT repeat domain-containing protein [Deltaproteobacteria bacterium]|nr:HEAT repeat domain-containing protein [Deltaproteobacteria bacterium]
MTASELLAALASGDAEVRRTATARASELVEPEVVEILLRALGDEDWRVRKEAARVAAGQVRLRAELVGAIVCALETEGNVGLRNSAVESLVGIGPDAVQPLVARLGSMSASAQKFAIEALGDIRDPRGLPALLEFSQSEEPNLRAAAVESLGRVGGAEAVRALQSIVLRENRDPFLRLAALEACNRASARLPVSLLVPLLSDRILRRAAIEALGRTVDPGAVHPLFVALRDHVRGIAAASAISLGELARHSELRGAIASEAGALGPAELGLFADLLRSGSAAERVAATRLLDLTGQPSATALLAEAAAEDDLAGLVDEALRRRGPAAAADLVAATRTVPERALSTLLPIAAELARIAGHEVVKSASARLSELLGSDDDLVAAAAAQGLGILDCADAIGLLVERVQRGSARTARAAGLALAALGGRNATLVQGRIASIALEAPGGALLCGVLGAVGTEADVPRLQAALGSADSNLRRAAVEALARVGGEGAREAVIFALADERPEVQAAAARALGALGGARALESLVSTLGSAEPMVVAAAARALVEIGDQAAVPALRSLVGSASGAVAMAGLEALRGLGDPRVGDRGDDELLIEALGHPDPEVVKQALRSLAKISDPRGAVRLATCLDHAAWDVRRLAAELLGESGLQVVRPALDRRLACERDDLVRAAIERALGKLA